MRRPKDLFFPIAGNYFKGFLTRIGGAKRDVVDGVPVLGGKDGEPFFFQQFGRCQHFINKALAAPFTAREPCLNSVKSPWISVTITPVFIVFL
jgi:hypothetical protein